MERTSQLTWRVAATMHAAAFFVGWMTGWHGAGLVERQRRRESANVESRSMVRADNGECCDHHAARLAEERAYADECWHLMEEDCLRQMEEDYRAQQAEDQRYGHPYVGECP